MMIGGRPRGLSRGLLVFVLCAVFFPLPLLGGFTDLLDGEVYSGITWAWLYALAQFPVSILVAHYYVRGANEAEDAGAEDAA